MPWLLGLVPFSLPVPSLRPSLKCPSSLLGSPGSLAGDSTSSEGKRCWKRGISCRKVLISSYLRDHHWVSSGVLAQAGRGPGGWSVWCQAVPKGALGWSTRSDLLGCHSHPGLMWRKVVLGLRVTAPQALCHPGTFPSSGKQAKTSVLQLRAYEDRIGSSYMGFCGIPGSPK